MKIKKMLELHQQNTVPMALVTNFGDGFLLQKNQLYRIIRSLALREGFAYTTEFNLAYLTLPLSQLDLFLDTKKIPYFDNVSILWEVEKKIPNTTVWDEIVDNLKTNHVFHESCHAVARSLSKKYFYAEISEEKKLLQIMIEESFANSCELLAIIDVDDEAHRLFYEMNSYIFMCDDRSNLKNLIQNFGREFVFYFVVICYLHSNFMYTQFEDRNIERILKFLSFSSAEYEVFKKDQKKIKSLRSVAKLTLALNPRFRMVTSVFYLRLCGFKYQPNELKKIDFMTQLETDIRFKQFLSQLAKEIKI
ncbi:MAG: hypothetical protein L6Q37_10540 [Bdellovibrionaceae bacterium]|nr:hypothetical protein [Pseudobdellovibrionaceae bacterium]NUM57596.1 hypothetical protein [Pseudobdellovibrionaceae bacterium]